jgi:hypothetical protein
LASFNLFMILVFSHQPFLPFVLILGLALWAMRRRSKPRRAGKPLPYLRRRR